VLYKAGKKKWLERNQKLESLKPTLHAFFKMFFDIISSVKLLVAKDSKAFSPLKLLRKSENLSPVY
jgi:hypothetical protein